MHIFYKLCITIDMTNAMHMEEMHMGTFKIPETPPTINKTIRFPSDVVVSVENAIMDKDCSFSAFVIAAVRAALADLENE